MDLKRILAVRHGDYIASVLTDLGKQQAHTLAESIQSKINGASKVVLLASPTKRTVETASIIGAQLGIEHQQVAVLELDRHGDGERQMKAVLGLAEGCDVVVVVTHYEAPSGIINAFSQKHFGREVKCEVVPKGRGMSLSLESGEVNYLP